MAEKQGQFDEKIIKRLQFVKWLEVYSGRPDRHGVQIPLPTFETESVKSLDSSRRNTSFIPDNTTGA